MAEQPASRRLRIFAFDPSLATRLETATINELTLEVPWESLGPGPIGEYLEVIDVDPASGACYEPGEPERPPAARHRRIACLRVQSPLPSADGLWRRHEDHPAFRAGARAGRPLVRSSGQRRGGLQDPVRPPAPDLLPRSPRSKCLLQPGSNQHLVRVADSSGGIREGLIVMPVAGRAAILSAVRYIDTIADFKRAVRSRATDTPEFRRIEKEFRQFYAEPRGRRRGLRSREFDYLLRHGDIIDALPAWRGSSKLHLGGRIVKSVLTCSMRRPNTLHKRSTRRVASRSTMTSSTTWAWKPRARPDTGRSPASTVDPPYARSS
jgi:hypothetical protein